MSSNAQSSSGRRKSSPCSLSHTSSTSASIYQHSAFSTRLRLPVQPEEGEAEPERADDQRASGHVAADLPALPVPAEGQPQVVVHPPQLTPVRRVVVLPTRLRGDLAQ